MQHQNTILHALLKHVGRRQFDRFVAAHDGDHRVRELDCWSQFSAMVFAQLAGVQSLRELEGALTSHGNLLYHVGMGSVRRSTLSDANARRPAAIFAAAFAHLLDQAAARLGSGERREMLRLVDATLLPLSGGVSEWAQFSQDHVAAKLHLVFDPRAALPTYFAVTAANINDISVAKTMPIEAGATYVFDKGYYDFGWWAALDGAGCRFVTRRKSNSPVTLVRTRRARGAGIESDRIVRLSQRMAASRRNPYAKPLREIVLRTEDGRRLALFSNDLKSPARQIAELYKTRWQIELFFKWIKQNLRIKKFLGTSANAVRIQILTALIAYLLIRLTQLAGRIEGSLQTLARLVRSNLMQRKPIANLTMPPPRTTAGDHAQLALELAHA